MPKILITMKTKILILALIIITISACQKLNLQVADTDVAVIECYISPDNPVSLKIFQQLIFESEDTTVNYLNDLTVRIKYNDQWYNLSNDSDGIYISNEIPLIVSGEYELEIVYNEKTITAITTIPSKPEGFTASDDTIKVVDYDESPPEPGADEPDPITLSWDNDNSDYYLLVVENIEDDPVLINDTTDRPAMIFRSEPTQDYTQDINSRSFMYYGLHRIILYKLNAEYAELYEQLGTSSLDITAPPSNIENGLGIFTGVNSDTLYIRAVSN